MTDETAPEETPKVPRKNKRQKRQQRIWVRSSWAVIQSICMMAFFAFFVSLLAIVGRTATLPDFATSAIERNLNKGIGADVISIGQIAVGLTDSDYRPTIVFRNVEVAQADAPLVALPELTVKFDSTDMLKGEFLVEAVELSGATLELKRGDDGFFEFALAGNFPGGFSSSGSAADIFDVIDEAFENPRLRELEYVRATDVTLDLLDQRTGKRVQIDNGRVEFENLRNAFSASVSFGATLDDGEVASLIFAADKAKGVKGARLIGKFDNVRTKDLASQVGALNWLETIDAPISGALTAEIGDEGQVATLAGTLTIGTGVVSPTPETKPIPFNSAKAYVRYEAAVQRLYLDNLSIDAPELRLEGSGHADLLDFRDGVPQVLLAQTRFANVKLDPEGVFEDPVTFDSGGIDFRYRPKYFQFDVGQLVLRNQNAQIVAKAEVSVEKGGWRAGLDAQIEKIDQNDLLALWPRVGNGNTRRWLTKNIRAGTLTDATASLRVVPGEPLAQSVTFNFQDADVSYLKTLPPVRNGVGYGNLTGETFTLVLQDGVIVAGNGKVLDVSESVFQIPDVSAKPTMGEVSLQIEGPLQGALSILDERPFEFLSKADLTPDIATGTAKVAAFIAVPLEKDVKVKDLSYNVAGDMFNVVSSELVPDRVLKSEKLSLSAGNGRLTIGGKGTLDGVPFNAEWARGLGPESDDGSTVVGSVEVTPKALDVFEIGLPKGVVSGKTSANIRISLQEDRPPDLTLNSSLKGIGLKIDTLGWSKKPAEAAKFSLAATLGPRPSVRDIRLTSKGLEAKGSISVKPDGGLDRVVLTPLKVAGKLNSRVEIVGRGRNRPALVMIKGGEIDIRKFGVSKGGRSAAGGGNPLDLALDRLVVTDSVALHKFQGKFKNNVGLDGSFKALINGGASVKGRVVPTDRGPAVRIKAADGGKVLRSAGIIKNARGGALDLTLRPRKTPGHFRGDLKIENARIKKAPALADLLSAISVVGLLEQLSGDGILFSNVEATFELTPAGVRLTRSSAVGPSMGITMDGVYNTGNSRMNMRGVISPIYIVNGLFGRLFSPRKGEGLVGFNYTLKGQAAEPRVGVNPLSILTPGAFREIFRQPPPKLSQ